MKTFRVTYARTVVMSYDFEAADQEAADDMAWEMERGDELGLDLVRAGDLPRDQYVWLAKPGNTIDDVEDDDATWEIEEVL